MSGRVSLTALAGMLVVVPSMALADDIPGNANTNATLKVTGPSTATRTGDFETEGDSDWYKVELTEGRDVAVAADESTSSFGQLIFRLRRAGGGILATGSDDPEAGSSGFEFRPTRTGKHFLELKQIGSFDEPYGYATRISRDCRRTASTLCRLTVGESEKGALTWALDEDWLRVRLTVGNTYSFKVDQVQFLDAVALKLYDKDGDVVAEGQESGDALLISNFGPTESGRYFVAVEGLNDEISGAILYRVALRRP